MVGCGVVRDGVYGQSGAALNKRSVTISYLSFRQTHADVLLFTIYYFFPSAPGQGVRAALYCTALYCLSCDALALHTYIERTALY